MRNVGNSVPGPCDYCRTTGTECHIDLGKRRQRPYYFVSEEEFRNMQDILSYYLPEANLSPENLRSLAAECKSKTSHSISHNLPASPLSLSPIFQPALSSGLENELEAPPAENVSNIAEWEKDSENRVLQEVFVLHQQSGCLVEDSQGQYRKF